MKYILVITIFAFLSKICHGLEVNEEELNSNFEKFWLPNTVIDNFDTSNCASFACFGEHDMDPMKAPFCALIK